MKRSVKNIIMLGIVLLMLVCAYFTINMNNSSSSGIPSMPNNNSENMPPSMPGNNENNNGDMFSESFKMPDENMNEGENTPPEMPNGSTPPAKPNGDNSGPPSINNNEESNTLIYVLLGIESLIASTVLIYLLMSNFNKKSFKETYEDKNKLIISGLGIIILTGGLTYLCSTFVNKNGNSNSPSGIPNGMGNSSNITYSSQKEITTNEDLTSSKYSSTNSDENAIIVSGNVTSNISNIEVSKSGDSEGGDSTSFYGNNSAILAKDGAVVNISNSTITTDANGANGVFSYGGSATTNNSSSDGTTVNISDSIITTTGNNSGGIMTTGGGVMNANNLTIKTSGTSSAAIRSDRGGGEVTVDSGTYETSGQGSPTIYSTANIKVSNATLTATASEGVVIEGANSVTLNNCNLTDTNNKLNGQSTTYKNIFLYQSMSGDAKEGGSIFTANNSSITTNKGDSFYITNTTATINLDNNTIINNDSTGYFLRGQADSWGNSGSNGGIVTLNLNNQDINGNIYIDKISTLTMNMTNSSYTGFINSDNIAKSIIVKLDSNSSIKLTGDSYITSLEDEDTTYSNIDFNGYKLYVNNQVLSK